MNEYSKEILLILLIENIMERRTCIYYQGDEEPCLRGEHFLTCNCNGKIQQCEFLRLHMAQWDEQEEKE